jgi:hypothetical protein
MIANGREVAVPRERDVRLDVFRGLALCMIFIDHMPGNVFGFVTLQRFGFSDAAELFVLIAGISSILAFSRAFERDGIGQGVLAIGSRIWTLYIAHIVMFVVTVAIAAFAAERFGDASYIENLALDAFIAEPAMATLRAVTLTYQPNFLDILPLYIVLLAGLPLIILAFRLHLALPLIMSTSLYALVSVYPFNLPNVQAAQVWYFNPFAWQLLFVIGATVAEMSRRRVALPQWRHVITAAALAYVVFSFTVAAPWRALPGLENLVVIRPEWLPAIDKTGLDPLRLVDVLARFWLVIVFLSAGARVLRSTPSLWLAHAGRHSLEVFCLGLVLSLVGGIIMRETGYHLAGQVAVTMAGIAMMISLGWALSLRKASRAGASGSIPAGKATLALESPSKTPSGALAPSPKT